MKDSAAALLIKKILTHRGGVVISSLSPSTLLDDDIYICFDDVFDDENKVPMINVSHSNHDLYEDHRDSDGMCTYWSAYICPKTTLDLFDLLEFSKGLVRDDLLEVYGPDTEEVKLVINYIKALSL